MKWLVALALLGTACGEKTPEPKAPPPPEVPDRALTAGDELLALAPGGADAIIELDLARLRDNAVVGPVFRALAGPTDSETPRIDLFGLGDLIVIASYDIGSDNTERLVLLRGDGVENAPEAVKIGEKTAAIASEAMHARLRAVAAGSEPSLAGSSELVRLRALAMPEKAEGAALRLAAHLDFNAQLALAKALDLDEVPVSVSVWGDVADDLAVVALVSGKTASDGSTLAGALTSVRDKLAKFRPLRALALGPIIRRARVENRGAAARLVLLVGPRRLKSVVERMLTRLGVGVEKASAK